MCVQRGREEVGRTGEPAEGGQAPPPAQRARGSLPPAQSSDHLHVELARRVGGADACVRLAGHVLNLDVVLCVALAPAPEKQQHQTEEDDAQEGDEAHGGGDDEGLDVEGERHGGAGAVGLSLARLVGDEGEGLVGLMGPIRRVAAHMQVGRHGVVAARVGRDAQVRAVVLYLGVAHLQRAVGEDREPPVALGRDQVLAWREPEDGGRRVPIRPAHELHRVALVHEHLLGLAVPDAGAAAGEVIGQEHVGEVLELLALDELGRGTRRLLPVEVEPPAAPEHPQEPAVAGQRIGVQDEGLQVAHRVESRLLQRGQLIAGDVEHAQVVEATEGVGLHHGQLPAHQLDLLQPEQLMQHGALDGADGVVGEVEEAEIDQVAHGQVGHSGQVAVRDGQGRQVEAVETVGSHGVQVGPVRDLQHLEAVQPLEGIVPDSIDVEVPQPQDDETVQVGQRLGGDGGQIAFLQRQLLQAIEAAEGSVGDVDEVVVANLQRLEVVQVLEHVVQQDDDLVLADVQLGQVTEAGEYTQGDELQAVAAEPQRPEVEEVVEGAGLHGAHDVLVELQLLQVREAGKLVLVERFDAVLAQVQQAGLGGDAFRHRHEALPVAEHCAVLGGALAAGRAARGRA